MCVGGRGVWVWVCEWVWMHVCMHVCIQVREEVYCTNSFNQQLGDTLIRGWVIIPVW